MKNNDVAMMWGPRRPWAIWNEFQEARSHVQGRTDLVSGERMIMSEKAKSRFLEEEILLGYIFYFIRVNQTRRK